MKKYLTLENGDVFVGEASGDTAAEVEGELIFTTSMTGYQETVTDPSYTGQIICFTYPLIGNYGISKDVSQSKEIAPTAVVASEIEKHPYHYESVISMDDFLKEKHVPAITGIDTRELTKVIRKHGTMAANLTNHPVSKSLNDNNEKILSKIKLASMSTSNNSQTDHVVLIDFGVKNNIIKCLQDLDVDVTVVAPDVTFEDIEQLNPTGILISNGPGDPTEYTSFLPVIRKLQDNYPLLGICLGNQLLALANGAKTYKMTFGHRGINHPVKNLETGKIYITSHNHGYAVDADSIKNTPLKITEVEVNDGTVEGLRLPGKPVFSVQYHPEAAPGPHDATKIFNDFINIMHESEGVK